MRLSCQMFFEWFVEKLCARNYWTWYKLLWPKYQETEFPSSQGHVFYLSWLLPDFSFFTGRCTGLVVRFTAFCYGTTFLISKLAVSVCFTKAECLLFSYSKLRWRLVGSFFASFISYYFNCYFEIQSWSAPAYFHSIELRFIVLTLRLLLYLPRFY